MVRGDENYGTGGGKKVRRRGFFLLFMFIVITQITGCSGGQQAPRGNSAAEVFSAPQYQWQKEYPKPLKVMGIYPDLERTYLERAFSRYEELTGNRLELIQVDREEFDRRMSMVFQGLEEEPDVILSYGGTNIDSYHPDENFYDFSDAPWVEDLTDTSINQAVYNGRIIGIPHWEASVSGTIYNKTIFKRCHLEIPENQAEFMELCEALLENGITPLYVPGKEISMLLYQFPLDSVVEDTAVLNGLNDRSLSYGDIPEMKQIVTWYKTMADKGYMGDSYLTGDWSGMDTAMGSGQYAMMLCWDTWLYTDYTGDPEEFGLMPAFMGVPEEGTYEGPNLGLFLVNQKSGNLDNALNFITFLSDPYNYNAAFEGIYTAPVFKNQVNSISTPQYQEAERLIERKYRSSTAWLRIKGFSQMDAAAIREYMKPGAKGTAEECLEEMDRLRDSRLDHRMEDGTEGTPQ